MSFALVMKLIFKQLVVGLKKHLWLMSRLYIGIVSKLSKFFGISPSMLERLILSAVIILIAYTTLY